MAWRGPRERVEWPAQKGTGGVAGGTGTGGVAGTKGTGGSAGGSSGGYNPCPTNGDPCKVLPLGDSITYGLITVAADKASSDASVNGKDSHGGYRVKLFSDAVAANHKMTFVGSQMNGPTTATSMPFPKSHEGWSGYTIAQIQGKAASDLTSGAHIILVHAGTNDTYGSDPSGAPARLSTLVDYLTSNYPTALIVVAKIIPYPSQTTNTNLINNSIAAMVQSKVSTGKHVIVADLNTGFTTSSMLAGDGVHPNQKRLRLDGRHLVRCHQQLPSVIVNQSTRGITESSGRFAGGGPRASFVRRSIGGIVEAWPAMSPKSRAIGATRISGSRPFPTWDHSSACRPTRTPSSS